MIKLLYKLFRKIFNKLVFEDQAKPKRFENYKFSFVDQAGNKYYEPIELGMMSIERYAEFQKCIGELRAAVSYEEVRLTMNALKSAREKDDWDMVSFIAKEWELREKTIIPRETMYNIIGVYFIREDENPEKIDHEIHNNKTKYFKDNVQILGFFLKNELMTELLGLPAMSASQLNLISIKSQERIQTFQKMLEVYQSQNASLKTEKSLTGT